MKKSGGCARIFFSGDCVGNPGRSALAYWVPRLRRDDEVDFFVANAENAAGGRGVTAEIVHYLLGTVGVDVVTTGDHIWDNKGVFDVIDKTSRLLRPDNLSSQCPGRGATCYEKNGLRLGVVQVLGRTFVALPSNCPFDAAKRQAEALRAQTPIVLVEMHAEATSEKIAMGRYLDGQVSAVVGTHTHVQTADEKILPGGTAYLTDAGMTGPEVSILGRDVESVVKRFVTGMYAPFTVARGPVQLDGILIDVDVQSGRAVGVERVHRVVGEDELKNAKA